MIFLLKITLTAAILIYGTAAYLYFFVPRDVSLEWEISSDSLDDVVVSEGNNGRFSSFVD